MTRQTTCVSLTNILIINCQSNTQYLDVLRRYNVANSMQHRLTILNKPKKTPIVKYILSAEICFLIDSLELLRLLMIGDMYFIHIVFSGKFIIKI